MKLFLYPILFFTLLSSLFATDKIVTRLVTTPVYHGSAESGVQFAKIPHVGWDLNAFWHSEFYSSKHELGPERFKQDINLISLYKVKVDYSIKNQIEIFSVNTSKGKKPVDCPYSLKEVAQFAAKAIRSDFPDVKLAKVYIDGKEYKVEGKEAQTPKADKAL